MAKARRSNIGRRTRHARQQQVYSQNLSEERLNIIRENNRLRYRVSRGRSLASYNRLQHVPSASPPPANEANTVVEEVNDSVAIVEPPELIEINDDDDESDKPDLKRPAAEDFIPSLPLKIQKIESLNLYSDDSADAELLARRVDNYKDALRLLKPLEEFALLEENYRAIGLLIQLEKIFEGTVKQPQNVK